MKGGKGDETLKDVWSALSDPTRRRILELLRQKEHNAGEIAAHFEMSKPSISKHLDILKQTGLVRSEKRGQYMVYALNTSVMEDAATLLFNFISKGSQLNETQEDELNEKSK